MKRGFTLVELLVVVTVIVVLLALLVPAMDKAVYQAELAVCGANLKTIGSGVQAYALDFKRAYPVRPALTALQDRPVHLTTSRNNGTTYLDDRPIIQKHIPLKLLLCPLDGKIAIGIGETDPASSVWSNYALWYGWGYAGKKRMRRMSDRFEWDDARYSLLASDWDGRLALDSNPFNTHPDTDSRMSQTVVQDEDGAVAGGVTAPINKATASYWTGLNRGPVDNNYAYDDGSVRRIGRSLFNQDPRLAAIPFAMSENLTPPRQNFVPKE